MNIKPFITNALISLFSQQWLQKILSNINQHQSFIFMLHRIQDPLSGITQGHDPSFIQECIQTLRDKGFQIVTVDDIVAANLAGKPLKKAAAFTLDDGYLDQANAAKKLFSQETPATIFVITDFIDGTMWQLDSKLKYIFRHTQKKQITLPLHSKQITLQLRNPAERKLAERKAVAFVNQTDFQQGTHFVNTISQLADIEIPEQPPKSHKPMSWDDANELNKLGVKIGAHTRKHPILKHEEDQRAYDEIHNSIERINEKISSPSKIFCYPVGRDTDFSKRDGLLAKQAGCIGAVSALPGYYNAGESNNSSNFSINRFSMPDKKNDFLQIILFIENLKEKIRYKPK